MVLAMLQLGMHMRSPVKTFRRHGLEMASYHTSEVPAAIEEPCKRTGMVDLNRLLCPAAA